MCWPSLFGEQRRLGRVQREHVTPGCERSSPLFVVFGTRVCERASLAPSMHPDEVRFLGDADELPATILRDQSAADIASRWITSHGTILRSQATSTPACRPDDRPGGDRPRTG